MNTINRLYEATRIHINTAHCFLYVVCFDGINIRVRLDREKSTISKTCRIVTHCVAKIFPKLLNST